MKNDGSLGESNRLFMDSMLVQHPDRMTGDKITVRIETLHVGTNCYIVQWYLRSLLHCHTGQ